MALSDSQIFSLAKVLDGQLKGDHLSGFVEFDTDVFFWQTSKKKRLCLVLSHDYPRIYFGGEGFDTSSLNSTFSTLMRKMLSRAKIISIHAENDERILYIELERTNEVYKKEHATLVFEMLPIQPKLILLDENKSIIVSTHYSSLDSKRPMLKGMTYTLPDKGNFMKKADSPAFSYEDYSRLCINKENELLAKRKLSFAGTSLKQIANRKKAIEKKIKAIKGDIENARGHLQDSDYGDFIYTNFDSFYKGMKEFVYEGKTISLDEAKSPQDNASNFYKRAKKAKKALLLAEQNLSLAESEKEALLIYEKAIESSSFEELGGILNELGLNKKKGNKQENVSSLAPYLVVNEGTRYLFGKNAKQNDHLSFVLTQEKSYFWFHSLQGAGAHLVIFKPEPSEDEIQLACELVLLASGKIGGEVMYTKRANIKRGNFLGQAIVKEFSSAYIREISPKAKTLFEAAQRIKLGSHIS